MNDVKMMDLVHCLHWAALGDFALASLLVHHISMS